MIRINRRQLIALGTALVPSFLLRNSGSAEAATAGTKVTKSSTIKVGQTKVFTGQTTSGQRMELILTRTKKGLFALNGACTHQGCAVSPQGAKLICPCHGSIFANDTGACIMGPNGAPKNSLLPLAKFTTTEKGGYIYIK
ncbi:MAG: Rieske 2Fe-2S domain-containing protein [Actinobacteria bacterium]|uniref:Unannotated protein n=1 Tax=freshwater metagenome TaxID=449393 RepID=A0A6J6TYQ5_9ZZZZ|nr:Rieske (2Fe-2S) protein [Actinomycetota bacterium]MSW47845.1 Rieske 2Fe-2S domain-containing protein [Actinomycetota bacterium]MSX25317.1 Rieske 2Fe-2S domain-containing protein [Actinomycetota bacterium]MSY46098.1 Rieske 2Fe-2S domain-containing protein [Actinomycetota bacterium]MSY57439.1 Rieske 2Fe-2S domain-containing protein [Actinomycetota bacterium]